MYNFEFKFGITIDMGCVEYSYKRFTASGQAQAWLLAAHYVGSCCGRAPDIIEFVSQSAT